jgi:serine/threonine protein kinase
LKLIKHPSIVEMKNMYQDIIRNTLYIVMEFINGSTLQDIVEKKGKI